MFQTEGLEKVKTRILCSIAFFPPKWCRLRDNAGNYSTAREATDDNTIRYMRFACWVIKATDIHAEYVIIIVFVRQKYLRHRGSMLYIYSACCVLLLNSVIAPSYLCLY
jgi:hypothetical protein